MTNEYKIEYSTTFQYQLDKGRLCSIVSKLDNQGDTYHIFLDKEDGMYYTCYADDNFNSRYEGLSKRMYKSFVEARERYKYWTEDSVLF